MRDEGRRGVRSEHNGSKKKHMTRRQRMRKRRRRLFFIETVLLVLLLGFLYAWLKLGLIHFDKLGLLATNNLDEKTQEMLEGYTTIAFFGVDEQQFPAQFISEAVDQTRGWFYSLMAESTLLFNKSPFSE